MTLDDLGGLRLLAVFFRPTTLKRALHQMGFVQADPIRAPARAQDLMLRHRVKDYRAGDLERRYAKLGVEEDFFINYGFVTRGPGADASAIRRSRSGRGCHAMARRRGGSAPSCCSNLSANAASVHPREVDEHFAHGKVKNYWGGSSNVTTHLLDAMHYHGLLRVERRDGGIRIYAAHQHGPGPTDEAPRRARIDQLVDVAVGIYAPMPARSLRLLVRRLRFAAPQWQGELTGALERARQRLAHTRVDGVDWYWPAGESIGRSAPPDTVRLLAPFDPLVWDRSRFEMLWGWVYRFEAYTPAAKRIRGYYALPLLWRDRVIGWANLAVKNGELQGEFGYVDSSPPRGREFKRELEVEMERMRVFLGYQRRRLSRAKARELPPNAALKRRLSAPTDRAPWCFRPKPFRPERSAPTRHA